MHKGVLEVLVDPRTAWAPPGACRGVELGDQGLVEAHAQALEAEPLAELVDQLGPLLGVIGAPYARELALQLAIATRTHAWLQHTASRSSARTS